jgi:hypothetical protein
LQPARFIILPPAYLKRIAKSRWCQEWRMRLCESGILLVRDRDMQLLKVVGLVEDRPEDGSVEEYVGMGRTVKSIRDDVRLTPKTTA